MPLNFLHRHKQFADLVLIVGEELNINPALVEKDYWIMHSLYGLQQMSFSFEFKGGTSLSKGHGIIDRFSEDIDIRIEPPADMSVAVNPNQQKAKHVKSRQDFYDWLAGKIMIDGIATVERDPEFDDKKYFRNGAIRLTYDKHTDALPGIRADVLLEVGFAKVAPNVPRTISSWLYDRAVRDNVEIMDNRAIDVACYHPGYTFLEKLRAISTKFRKQQEGGSEINFTRHYYDVYYLLSNPEVCGFIGTEDYKAYKKKCFGSGADFVLSENEAFLMNDPKVREVYARAFDRPNTLFYRPRPSFEQVIETIAEATKMGGI